MYMTRGYQINEVGMDSVRIDGGRMLPYPMVLLLLNEERNALTLAYLIYYLLIVACFSFRLVWLVPSYQWPMMSYGHPPHIWSDQYPSTRLEQLLAQDLRGSEY
jgi:hypothetical protein